MSEIRVRPATDGGFIVTDSYGEHVYTKLDDVFDYLLQRFEGRCQSFTRSSYGRVVVQRGHEKPDPMLQEAIMRAVGSVLIAPPYNDMKVTDAVLAVLHERGWPRTMSTPSATRIHPSTKEPFTGPQDGFVRLSQNHECATDAIPEPEHREPTGRI